MNKTTLYNVIKGFYNHRLAVYSRLRVNRHPDAERIYDLYTNAILAAAAEYKAAGGKRNVDKYCF